MAKKQDYILNYIKHLETGTKISIRSLADTLSVSEGTAYKAIKKAEELNMVHTRPRAGTVRIADETQPEKKRFSLRKLIHQLSLSIITGKENDEPIEAIIIGDGSIDQLCQDASKTSGEKLCIVGDRPDIQSTALSLHMHLLITGGASIQQNILTSALQKNLCIMSSLQSSSHILGLLEKLDTHKQPEVGTDLVSDWMQPPRYLYYNDIASDWYHTYAPIFHLNDSYAVVDDDLNICGLLSAASALSTSPTERISNVYDQNSEFLRLTVPKDITMHSLAEKMIAENSEIAFVAENGKLQGIITANDVLRFYRTTYDNKTTLPAASSEILNSDDTNKKWTWLVHLPASITATEHSLSENEFSTILDAISYPIHKIFGSSYYRLKDGVFYRFCDMSSSSRCELDCIVVNQSENSCTIEVEIRSDSICCAKYILNYSLSPKTSDAF